VAGNAKQLTYRIGADIGDLKRKMMEAGTVTREMRREMAMLMRQQAEHRQMLSDLGQGFLTYGAVVTAGLAVAGKAAMDWESAFTGVRKTVDGSPEEIAKLEAEMRNLARTLPATHEEIAGVAEAAGQLGIKRADIVGFTKVMIDLGNTTNLTAEDAATGLAKLSNIMGTSSSDADRLGSALVALGNDGASTEADILAMALRIAGAGRQIGLTEAQVLGFASALSSVGIEAEAGGSSISRVMISIEQAVRAGGKAVTGFSDVAGMSAGQFTKAYKDDAGAAIAAFIAGLNRMQKAGGDVFGVLDRLGFGEILVRDALLRTAGASDMLTKSLKVGTSAWAENNALTEEANKRYETSASKLQVAGNQIKDTLIDVGAAIAPIAVAGAQAIGDMVNAFRNLPGPVQEVVTWVGVATAVVGVFGGAALIAVPKLLVFRETMRSLIDVGGGMSGALGKFGLFMTGPWGAAIGIGTTLLGLFGVAVGGAQRRQEELASAGKAVADALREQNGVVNASVRQVAAKEAADKGLLRLARTAGIDLGTVTDAIINQGSAYNDLQTKLKAVAEAEVRLGAGDAANTMSATGEAALELSKNLAQVHQEGNSTVQTQKDITDASQGAAGATKSHAEQQENLATRTKEAVEALDALVKALDEINGVTLSYREAQRAYLDQLETTNQALVTNGKTLDINTKAGRENLAALDDQAKAANDLAEAAAREAQATGGATAGAEALKNSLDASRPALIEQAMKFGMSRDEAEKYTDSVLGIPGAASTAILTPGSQMALAELQRVHAAVLGVPPNKEVNVGVLSAAAQQTLRDLGFQVRTLPDGTVTVNANDNPARDRTNTLITDINNRSASLRINLIKGSNAFGQMLPIAQGGIVAYAGGGVHENHQPIVAKAVPGMVRVWAEPETDRESYIPWAMDRRSRATNVLRVTAEAFGYDLVARGSGLMRLAYGGTTGASPASAATRVEKHFHLAVYQAGNTTVDLRAQFARLETMSGL
jgi:TP901 family phage tail tape measure protein